VGKWLLRCFFTPFGRPVRLGPDAGLVWLGRRTYPRPLFTPNRSVGCAIPDNFGTNQWGRAGVSENDNHSLFITSKESQFAIQFFHYWLPLCPVQLRAVSWVNIVAKSNNFPFQWSKHETGNEWTLLGTSWKTIWLVDESDVVLILSLGDKWSDVRESIRGGPDDAFSLHFWGKTSVSSVLSEADRTPDRVKKRL